MIRKRQIHWSSKDDTLAQAVFIAALFGVAIAA
jgi:hypothetical protein